MSITRVVGVLVVLGFLGVAVAYFRGYSEARGRIVELERQRDALTATARELSDDRDSLRTVGDTIGSGASLENERDLQDFEELGRGADSVRIVIRQDTAALKLDSLRLLQIDALQQVHVRDSLTIVEIRRQLFDERDLHDVAMANAQEQIRNLELQVDAFGTVAARGWLDRLVTDGKVLAIGAALGAGACYLWCPRDETVVLQSGPTVVQSGPTYGFLLGSLRVN